MRTVRTKAELRAALAAPRRREDSIALVPTMGAFHEGHLSLMRRARKVCDYVVVSLFINPTQFGPAEDVGTYPADEARDAGLAEAEDVDLLYAPSRAEVYPDGFATSVQVSGLTEVLCGDPARRGAEHFRGVTTMVAKLFNTVGPDFAFFGQKDAQQALVIRKMAADLDIPVRIEVLPTVREPDGLALSSRNLYLEPDERKQAAALRRGLLAAERRAAAGEASAAAMLEAVRAELESAGVTPEYLEARDADDLTEIDSLNGRPILVAVAARVGKARLIDNTVIHPEGASD